MALRLRPAWLSAPRTIVGSVASLDLLFRIPPEYVLPLFSLVGGIAPIQTIQTVTTWLFFVVVLSISGPLAYSLIPAVPSRAYGFRAIFVAGTISLALLLPTLRPTRVLAAGLLIVALAGGCFVAYLSLVRGWALYDSDGRVVQVLEGFFDDDDPIDHSSGDKPGFLNSVRAHLHLFGLAFVLAIPVFPAAVITLALIRAYPLPDLLALGWVAAGVVLPRLPRTPDGVGPVMDTLDLEGRLLDAIENATRSFQGVILTVLISLGLVAAALYLWVSVTTSAIAVEAVRTAMVQGLTVEPALYAWNTVGIPVLFLLSGGLTTLAWLVEFNRLPAYLDSWEEEIDPERTVPPRPTAAFLVSAGMVAVTMAFLLRAIGPMDGTIGPYLWTHILYGVAWPMLSLVAWRERPVRSPLDRTTVAHEPLWIGGWLLSMIYAVQIPLTVARPTTEFVTFLVAPPLIVFLLLGLPLLNKFDQTLRDRAGWRRYALGGFLTGWGGLLLLSLPFISEEYDFVITICAGLLISAGAISVVVRYQQSHR